ncbi:hypothetical protein, partial [Neisseria zoodegmatis]
LLKNGCCCVSSEETELYTPARTPVNNHNAKNYNGNHISLFIMEIILDNFTQRLHNTANF